MKTLQLKNIAEVNSVYGLDNAEERISDLKERLLKKWGLFEFCIF